MLHDVEGRILADEVERLRAERDAAISREDATGYQVDALRRRVEQAETALLAVRVALRVFDDVPGDLGELDALRDSVRAAITAIESGAIFDWYQRDALVRRLRAHVDDGGHDAGQA
jgi:hypothetical protein